MRPINLGHAIIWRIATIQSQLQKVGFVDTEAGVWPLPIVAYVSFASLVLYCLTYTTWWFFNPLHRYEGNWWVRMLTYQAANLVAIVSFWFVWLALTKAIDAIAKAQGA
jgi:uncharacterized membrane protein YkvI